MRIMLLGANGFIGSAVLATLTAGGHEAIAVARSRRPDARRVRWLQLDIAKATTPADWQPHLIGVDAVVNCAGVLQEGPADTIQGVHVDGVQALFRACEAGDVRRVVHVSAIGADLESLTSFSATKKAGEDALKACDVDWVILRPSVVVGRNAYGGSALLRGLAALPFLIEVPDAGLLQIVQLDEVVATILFFVNPGAPARVELDVAGPERLSFEDVVAAYRRWLRFSPQRRVRVPRWLVGLVYRLGDAAGRLGWRSPMRSNARRELVRGATGNPGPWMEATGIKPRSLREALYAEPASVQERWFARLYFLKPLVLVVFALFWIVTGIISLGPGWEVGIEYMQRGGAGAVAAPGVVLGALADILVGVGIAVRRTAKAALWAALAISAFYIVAGTLILPELWADPIGPMMKIWPIMALNLVALAIVDGR